MLAEARLGAGEASFGVPVLPPGVYAVRVVTGEGAATACFTVVR